MFEKYISSEIESMFGYKESFKEGSNKHNLEILNSEELEKRRIPNTIREAVEKDPNPSVKPVLADGNNSIFIQAGPSW